MSDLDKKLEEVILYGGVKEGEHGFDESGFALEDGCIERVKQAFADEIGEMIEVQGVNGTWNHDPYMHGMYNGMEFCYSLVKGVEPKYRSTPAKWLTDNPTMTKSEWEANAIKDGWVKTDSSECRHDWSEFRDGHGHKGEKCLYCFEFRHMSATEGSQCLGSSYGYVGPDTVLPRPSLTGEQLKAISKEWSKPRMTGQEWYNKFWKEFGDSTNKANYLADQAAKKAAGIE